MPVTDTIAAIATASGQASIGVIRLSGSDAFAVSDRLARRSGEHKIALAKGHTLHRATIYDPQNQEPIDDVLLAVFHAPRSFTGEDIIEIQGHGGSITLKRLFAAALSAGARSARPGEFSERAFANGKLDLAQAEAIADLISAGTVAAQRAAQRQLHGSLSRAVQDFREDLQYSLAQIEASIDFPEEVGEADVDAVDTPLMRTADGIAQLLATANYGKRLREGMTVVLTGQPNVGKSSLLNALAGSERAIVTSVPGTTRDVIEESLHIGGIPIRALDTAGLRDTDDPVEQIGVARARRAVEDADVVVVVLDATRGVSEGDIAFLRSLENRPAVVCLNKADQASIVPLLSDLKKVLPATTPVSVTAAVNGAGIAELSRAIVEAVGASEAGMESAPLVTSARHEAALTDSARNIEAARDTLHRGLPIELVAVDVHGALRALGEITGETAREDIIAGIFARFCIGK